MTSFSIVRRQRSNITYTPYAQISAEVFGRIGESFQGDAANSLGHVGAHGFAGGVLAELQGGKFGHGFVSAGLSRYGGNKIGDSPTMNGVTRTLARLTLGGTISKITGGKFTNGAVGAAFAMMVQMVASGDGTPEKTRNQSSIDRVNNLSDSIKERQRIYDQGFEEAKAQNLSVDETKITPKLDEIRVAVSDGDGGYDYRSFTHKSDAVSYLEANPSSFVADGVYHGGGDISIYATATSPGTKLYAPYGGLLETRLNSGLRFQMRMNGVENVLQTIAHETGHHLGFGHDAGMYNREYIAVKTYRSQ